MKRGLIRKKSASGKPMKQASKKPKRFPSTIPITVTEGEKFRIKQERE